MRKPLIKALTYLLLTGVGFAVGKWSQPVPGFKDEIPTVPSDNDGGLSPPVQDTRESFSSHLPRLQELAGKEMRAWNQREMAEGRRPGQDQIEIEAIFAFATREELISWFSESEKDETNGVALNAAFARLASLSLDEAIDIWTDRNRRIGDSAGVAGLVRTWAGIDPAAAEVWVSRLTDRKTKGPALHALLDTVVETSPDLVERHLVEHGMMVDDYWIFESVQLVTRLAEVVPQARLPILAERILSEKQGNWEYQNQLTSLLKTWGERDTAAMMTWLLAQPKGTLKDHVVPGVVESLAAKEPATFLEKIAPMMAGNETVAQMAGGTWLSWLSGEDADAAMEWFKDHGDQIQVDLNMVWRGQSLKSEESERVLSRLADLPEGETKATIAKAMLHQLSQSDPKSALEHIDGMLPPGHDTDIFIASTLSNLAREGDPSGALAWALENLAEGQGKNDAVRFVMSSWTDANPVEAVKNARLLSGVIRDNAYNGIAHQWAEKAPEQMLMFLEKQAGTSEGELANDGFWQIGYKVGGDAYLARALALSNETLRSKAVEGYFGGWSRANLESSAKALETMERGSLRDTAVTAFVSNARWADREAAMIWSFEIGDPAKRRNTVLDQGRRWLNADREAATKWIETSGKLSEEWRAELLKPAK